MNRQFTKGDDTLLVLITDTENTGEVTEGVSSSILNYSGFDWDRDLSPWPAGAVFKGSDFGGNADAVIKEIRRDPIFNEKWKSVYGCGYSMAGLFVLYMSEQCGLFNGIASCSGSLWYDGFLTYLSNHPARVQKVYLSVGDRESHSRNARLKTVVEATRQAAALISEYADVCFELNNGTHFDDVEKRINKGIKWLLYHDEHNMQ